jgi:serine/threonine protein kinase
MTDYVATRWYRSPELILTCEYNLPVDIWAVGCIMGELIDGQPMFPGDDTLDQIYQIMKVVGTFDERLVRLFNENAAFKNVKFPDVVQGQSLEQRYKKKIDRVGINLLSQLLSIDEKTRPTAEQALLHPFFASLLKEDIELVEELRRENQSILQATEARLGEGQLGVEKGLGNQKGPVQPKADVRKIAADKENIPNKISNQSVPVASLKGIHKCGSPGDSDREGDTREQLETRNTHRESKGNPKLTESFHEKQGVAKPQIKNKSENMDYKAKANTKKFVTANSTNFVIKKVNNFGFSLYNPKESTHAKLGKKAKHQPWSMAQSSMFRGNDVYGNGSSNGLFPSIHNFRPNETRSNWMYKGN